MFILGDESHDRGKLPFVTFTLIAVNFLVFCAQFRFGEPMTNGLALVPKEITEFRDLRKKQPLHLHQPNVFVDDDGEVFVHRRDRVMFIQHYRGPQPIFLTLITYMFLHGDILHLLFNLWFLFIFGRNVECALDHGKFLGFYLFCGVLAGIAQVGAAPDSIIPIVGASGAIAGVMGAYLAIFPWNKIKVLFGGIGLMFGVVEIPAFLVVGFWFLGEFLIGMVTMNDEIGGGTAYWCHIGGFLSGFLIIKGLLLYFLYQIKSLEAEHASQHAELFPDEPPPPPESLLQPDVPTPEQLDNLLDPVETFKRARQSVFRNVPENDPFNRGDVAPESDRPRVDVVDDEIEHGIQVKH